jgi:hypothetical protein
MKNMMTAIKILLVIAILTGAGIFVVNNWAWVFSKTVEGEIINVERVTEPTAILSARTKKASSTPRAPKTRNGKSPSPAIAFALFFIAILRGS